MRRIAVLPLLVVVAAAAPRIALAQAHVSMIDLISQPGVSGFEDDIRGTIRRALPPSAKARVDEIGNLIVTVGQGRPHVLVCANMDEDGYFVSGITEGGYLRVQRVTTGVTNRLFEQMHYGQPVSIRTQSGKRVPGVFAAASTHLQRGRDQSSTPKGLDDLWIDVGAENRAQVDALGIQMLDPVSLRERSQEVGTEQISGVSAQARAMDYALVHLLMGLASSPSKAPGTVTIAFTTQGSFGERGMARLAQEIPDADQVIVLARTPMPRDGNNPRGAVGRLGAGPLVADNDAKTIETARQQGIAVQPLGGVLRAPSGWTAAKTIVLSLPVLYAQTPVETVHGGDALTLAKLVGAMSGLSLPGSSVGGAGGGTGTGSSGLVGILEPLIRVTGVSGAETPVRQEIAKRLPKWTKPEVDERGNLTVSFGTGGKELVFVAHTDEVGYEITDVLEDGTAAVRKRGGFFDYLWEAHPVFVQTAKGAVRAIVAPRPNYLNATTATPRAQDVLLYFGTSSRAETQALGVAKGDTATVRKELTKLAGSRYTARSMDDRCGVAALLDALGLIDPAKVKNRVTFAFVVGEETGLEGSGFLAQRSHPAAVFAVDTFVSSDSPVELQRMALVPLGSAVVSRAVDNSSITPPETVARIISIGRANRIPVVAATTSGGNDGSQFSRYGSVVAPLSWPGRYSHSPVEVMDLRDLENLVRLITALAQEF